MQATGARTTAELTRYAIAHGIVQAAYKAAVEEWIAAIRSEEDLASGNHSVAEVDRWEQAHFCEEELCAKAKAAKAQYENALRFKFFAIPE